jgi:hypothetical protein
MRRLTNNWKQKGTVAAFSTGAVALLVPAIAWACTSLAAPALSVNGQPTGPSGGTASVSGSGFCDGAHNCHTAGGPIEMRWNGVQGQLLTQVNGGSFSNVQFKIPQVANDTYVITAVQHGIGSSEVVATASAPFTVSTIAAPGVQGYQGPGAANGTTPSAPLTTTTRPGPNGSTTVVIVRPGQAAVAAPVLAPTGSSITVSGDIWSGFLYTGKEPARLSNQPIQQGGNLLPVIATALFCGGLLALGGGVALAEARKRRVKVRAW